MRVIAIVIFILYGFIAISNDIEKDSNANNNVAKPEKNTQSKNGIVVLYSQNYYYNPIDIHASKNGNYLNSFGIGYVVEVLTSSGYDFPAYFLFSYLIPKTVYFDNEQRMYGFDMRVSLAGQNVVDNRYFHFFVTEGIGFGRLKLVNDKGQKMKNPFFYPFVGLVSKVELSKFSFLVIAQFNLDISSGKWKELWFVDGQTFDLPRVNQSGINLSVGVCYNI